MFQTFFINLVKLTSRKPKATLIKGWREYVVYICIAKLMYQKVKTIYNLQWRSSK